MILLVVALSAAGCGADGRPPPEPDTASPPSPVRDECRRYLSCLLAVAPQSYAAALVLYGDGAECWRTAEQTTNCAMACDGAFGGIAAQCTCVGTMCMAKPMVECPDDLAFEPNNSIQTAFLTTIGAGSQSVTYPSLAICPAADVDFFQLQTTTTTTVEAVATISPPGQLNMSLLVASGTPIASGVPSNNQVRATVPNAPAGIYYVRVSSGTKLSYQLVITAAP